MPFSSGLSFLPYPSKNPLFMRVSSLVSSYIFRICSSASCQYSNSNSFSFVRRTWSGMLHFCFEPTRCPVLRPCVSMFYASGLSFLPYPSKYPLFMRVSSLVFADIFQNILKICQKWGQNGQGSDCIFLSTI